MKLPVASIPLSSIVPAQNALYSSSFSKQATFPGLKPRSISASASSGARGYAHGQGPDAAGVPAHDVVAAADLRTQQLAGLIERLESGDTGAACGRVQLTSGDGGKCD